MSEEKLRAKPKKIPDTIDIVLGSEPGNKFVLPNTFPEFGLLAAMKLYNQHDAVFKKILENNIASSIKKKAILVHMDNLEIYKKQVSVLPEETQPIRDSLISGAEEIIKRYKSALAPIYKEEANWGWF